MKKILVLLAVMLPLCAAAEDVVSLDGLNEPEWKSFVPPAYVDVDEPKGLGKLNETAAYWYKRRIEFENGIQECRALEDSDAKLGCYQQLTVITMRELKLRKKPEWARRKCLTKQIQCFR